MKIYIGLASLTTMGSVTSEIQTSKGSKVGARAMSLPLVPCGSNERIGVDALNDASR